MVLTPRGELIAAIAAEVVQLPVNPNQSIDVNPETFVDPPVANELLFGDSVGPISASNVNSGQSLAVVVTRSQPGTGSNIQGFFGGATMTFSGLWKFTANIKAGDRGKSTSVIYQGSTNFDAAKGIALLWIDKLADTFGNEGALGVPITTGTAGSPYIKSYRVTDAINPRMGSIVKSPANNPTFCGKGTGNLGDASADFISTALSLRLTGTTTETNPPDPAIVNQIVYANHALLAIPDAVVINGDEINTGVPLGPQTFSYYAGLYIAWITNPVNRIGCLTTRLSEATFECTGFTRPAGELWQFVTSAPHGYVTGERVRLTRCNAPFFSGSYVVKRIDATTLAINGGPPASVEAPTKGKVRRYMDRNGVRLGVFAQFSLPLGQQVDPWNLAVSKRNPGRPFSLVSFPKKRRRAH